MLHLCSTTTAVPHTTLGKKQNSTGLPQPHYLVAAGFWLLLSTCFGLLLLCFPGLRADWLPLVFDYFCHLTQDATFNMNIIISIYHDVSKYIMSCYTLHPTYLSFSRLKSIGFKASEAPYLYIDSNMKDNHHIILLYWERIRKINHTGLIIVDTELNKNLNDQSFMYLYARGIS